MKKIGLEVAWWLLITVVTAVMATAIDPYLTLRSPLLAQAINAAIPVLLVWLVYTLTGRAPLSLLAAALITALFALVDHLKLGVLHNNLLYADFKVLPDILSQPHLVVGFVHLSPLQWAGAAAAILALVAVVIWSYRKPPNGWLSRGLAALSFVVVFAGLEIYPAPMDIASIGWNLPMQITGASQAGVTGNLLLGRMAGSNVLPHVDAKKVASFWAEPTVVAARAQFEQPSSSVKPDIVFVQSESLFEPTLLCGFPDQPFLTNVAAQKPAGFQNFKVPVFGHRTLQTEFEVLSGFPVAFAPKSLFSYYELVDRPVEALPRYMNRQGYKTVAVHPSLRSFWRRDYAMPAMGFSSFVADAPYFLPTDYSKVGWISDASLVSVILSELDAAREPALVYAISIENHGPWGDKPTTAISDAQLPAALTGRAREEMRDYLARSREADNSYGALLQALQKRAKPTIVVFYGDHLPALDGAYSQLCFKDGKRPEEHLPPLRVWSNFALHAPLPEQVPSNLLAGWVLGAAGLPLKDHFLAAAITENILRNPSVDSETKKRVFDGYSNVAADAVLFKRPVDVEKGLAYIPKERAAGVLLGLSAPAGSTSKPATLDTADAANIHLPSAEGSTSELTFDLQSRVASAVIRPVLAQADKACLTNPNAGIAGIEVLADGKLIMRDRRVTTDVVNVSTLALAGAKTLVVRTTTNPGSGDCDHVLLRVVQMACFSADCDVAGENKALANAASEPMAEESASADDTADEPLLTDLARAGFMMRRSVGFEAPYLPIKITPDNKLFLHPTVEKNAWIDLDISGIESLELTPAIQPLDKACSGIATAGIVGLTIRLDGKAVSTSTVDRDTKAVLPVKTGGAKTLRIDVDDGNDVAWCDWFSIGFSKIALKSAGASTPPASGAK